MHEYALLFRILAERVFTARLSTGQRILDASDFREWLLELSDKAENAATVDEFSSRLKQ